MEKQFEFYLANLDTIVEEYAERFVVIAEQRIIEDFPTEAAARAYAEANLAEDTYTIQFISPGQEPMPMVY